MWMFECTCYDSCGSSCFTFALNSELMLFTNKQFHNHPAVQKSRTHSQKHNLEHCIHAASVCVSVCIHTMWQDQMCLYLSSQWNLLNPSPGQIRYQLYWFVWPQPCCVWWFKSCDTVHLPTVHDSWNTWYKHLHHSTNTHVNPFTGIYLPKATLPQSYHLGWHAHTHSVNSHFLLGQGL